MANIIALIIFTGSFVGLVFLIFRKISVLASLPEQTEKPLENSPLIKQSLLQKTSQIKQAVLNNGKMGAVMAKATEGFKVIFANKVAKRSPEEAEKVEKIHNDGDYWQKIEEHKIPSTPKKRAPRKPRVKIMQASATEIIEGAVAGGSQPGDNPQPKKPRTRKKKAE